MGNETLPNTVPSAPQHGMKPVEGKPFVGSTSKILATLICDDLKLIKDLFEKEKKQALVAAIKVDVTAAIASRDISDMGGSVAFLKNLQGAIEERLINLKPKPREQSSAAAFYLAFEEKMAAQRGKIPQASTTHDSLRIRYQELLKTFHKDIRLILFQVQEGELSAKRGKQAILEKYDRIVATLSKDASNAANNAETLENALTKIKAQLEESAVSIATLATGTGQGIAPHRPD